VVSTIHASNELQIRLDAKKRTEGSLQRVGETIPWQRQAAAAMLALPLSLATAV
jgi:hypothetical protein